MQVVLPRLMADDALAQRIAAAGQEFAARHLSPAARACYWREVRTVLCLLTQAQLQAMPACGAGDCWHLQSHPLQHQCMHSCPPSLQHQPKSGQGTAREQHDTAPGRAYSPSIVRQLLATQLLGGLSATLPEPAAKV